MYVTSPTERGIERWKLLCKRTRKWSKSVWLLFSHSFQQQQTQQADISVQRGPDVMLRWEALNKSLSLHHNKLRCKKFQLKAAICLLLCNSKEKIVSTLTFHTHLLPVTHCLFSYLVSIHLCLYAFLLHFFSLCLFVCRHVAQFLFLSLFLPPSFSSFSSIVDFSLFSFRKLHAW